MALLSGSISGSKVETIQLTPTCSECFSQANIRQIALVGKQKSRHLEFGGYIPTDIKFSRPTIQFL